MQFLISEENAQLWDGEDKILKEAYNIDKKNGDTICS